MTFTPIKSFAATSLLLLAAMLFAPYGVHAEQGELYSPERGNPIRTEILNIIRTDVEQWVNHEVLFFNVDIRVLDDWAWATVEPRSTDGMNSYEFVTALLHKQSEAWTVAEYPGCEGGEEECFDADLFFKGVTARNPGVPQALFPEDW